MLLRHTFLTAKIHSKLYNSLNLRSQSQAIKSNSSVFQNNTPSYMRLSESFCDENEPLGRNLINSMVVHENFLSAEEENSIFDEIEPYLKRLHYEFAHWDDAIHGYRETERLKWNSANGEILRRVRKVAFPPEVEQLRLVHVLDLDEKGYIKPHIDAIRFCGDTIAGLSLLTDSVMRLVHDKKKELSADVLLKRRSLYVMNGTARYDYTHEILSNEFSTFDGKVVWKARRISVICRNEPKAENTLS